MGGGTKGPAMCSDAAIKLDDALQRQRARAANHPHGQPGKVLGCHGWSPIMKALPYLDYNNFWIIPMAHALLYGVVRSFWKLILTKPAAGEQNACALERM